MNLEDTTYKAIEICKKAGEILLNLYNNKDFKIDYKSRTNLVTSADYESQSFIVNELSQKFPAHGIVAEENDYNNQKGDLVWFVDPLDATNNFAHNIPFFSVTIALYNNSTKEILSGVVYNPIMDEMFYAWKEGGAYCNKKRINVSTTDNINISIIATGFPYIKDDMDKNNLKEFNKVLPNVQGIRRLGSASIDLCYVACGRFDGYWEPLLYPWDMAAGALIVKEAGGKVTKYNNTEFDTYFKEICATNGIIHHQLLSLLNNET